MTMTMRLDNEHVDIDMDMDIDQVGSFGGWVGACLGNCKF